MTLEKLSGGVDFVSDTTPAASDAIDGDVYLDTSLSPPQVKVFDASVGSFVRPQTAQNLDQKVSNSGQGVRWASKTPKLNSSQLGGSSLTVSGSGFLLGVSVQAAGSPVEVEVNIDGGTLASIRPDDNSNLGSSFTTLIHRFTSSFSVNSLNTNSGEVTISYVLD
jgi:hypothetical protein